MIVFDECKHEPTLIEYFKDYVIEKVKCGFVHCYAKSNSVNHFLFDRNGDNECMVFDDDAKYVHIPNQIDDIALLFFYSNNLFIHE